MDLNFIFLFFEIKIETKFEFMEFDCDVKNLLPGW